MKLNSDKYKEMTDVVSKKNQWTDFWGQKRESNALVRSFINGLSIAAESGEAEEELTNYLTSYKAMNARLGTLVETYTNTKHFCDITVRTGDIEGDALASAILTDAFNDEILYGSLSKRVFYNFVKQLAGEIQVTGGIPLVFTDNHAWLPSVENFLIDPDCDISCEDFSVCFQPKTLSVDDLRDLMKLPGKSINKKVIEGILEEAKESQDGEIQTGSKAGVDHKMEGSLDSALSGGVGNGCEATYFKDGKLAVWWMFEKREDGRISGTMFSENSTQESTPILAYVDKYAKSVEELFMVFTINTEIGGKQTIGTVRGIAEVIFPSANMLEVVLNTLIDGDLDRARPKYRIKDGKENTNEEGILHWASNKSWLMPSEIEGVRNETSSSSLSAPYQILGSNIASNASTVGENTGQLRVQAVETNRQNRSSISQMVQEWGINMESMMLMVLYRCFNFDVKNNVSGVNSIKRFRNRLKEAKIDPKIISKWENGGFKYLRVDVNHPTDDDETVQWLSTNLQNLPPQTRNTALGMILTKVSKDPRLQEKLIGSQITISNSQKAVAQNESQTIFIRAFTGEVLEPNPSDVHEDHIPEHFKDLAGMLMMNEVEPWKMTDLVKFNGLVLHCGEHLKIMFQNPTTQKVAKQFVQELDQFAAAAKQIQGLIQQQQEQEQQQKSSLTPMEQHKIQLDQAKLQLEQAELTLKGMKFGLDTKKEENLVANRNRRADAGEDRQTVQAAATVANLRLKVADLEAKRSMMLRQEQTAAAEAAASAPPPPPPPPPAPTPPFDADLTTPIFTE